MTSFLKEWTQKVSGHFHPTTALNEFTIPLTKEQIDVAFDAGVDTIRVLDVNTNELVESVIPRPRKTDEVKQLLVKEKWFFDRNHSVMNVRIIGICPVRVYNKLDDQGMPTDVVFREQTFWVYFDEIRPLLSNHEIFNRNNDAQRISFDDFFMQRRFNSYIWGESNVYDNRWINSYAVGVDALLEAEKIKELAFRCRTRSVGILIVPFHIKKAPFRELFYFDLLI